MIKKTITYTDYADNEVTEDFYFNLSRGELIEMQMRADGDLENYIQRIIKARNNKELVDLFTGILEKSYGVRTPDGRQFVKDETYWKQFHASEAYSELLIELISVSGAADGFINGLMPKKLMAETADATKQAEKKEDEPVNESRNVFDEKSPEESEDLGKKKPEDYTKTELLEMSQAKFDAICGTDIRQWDKRTLEIAFHRKTTGKA